MDERWQQWALSLLSAEKRRRVQRLIHSGDREVSLCGLLLLRHCVAALGDEGFDLSAVRYPERGKPYWQPAAESAAPQLDFNISHSAELIVAVASNQLRVGVDVEKIRPLQRFSYRSIMREQERLLIGDRPDYFFRLWTIKEAVVKAADTAGLVKIRDVCIKGQEGSEAYRRDIEMASATLDGTAWYINELQVDEGYCLSLATSAPVDELKISLMRLDELDKERWQTE